MGTSIRSAVAFVPSALLGMACGVGAASPPPAAPDPPVVELRVAAAPDAPTAPEDGEPDEASSIPTGSEPLTFCMAELREGRRVARAHPDAPGKREYAAGLAFERAGNLEAARKAYYVLVRDQPSSPYIPLVYLAFAEIFYLESEKDPSKLALAKQAYLEVTKYPPPDNSAWPYAQQQLARVHLRGGDFAAALSTAKKAVEAGAQVPDFPCAAVFAKRARGDIVEAYASAGRPERALDFFRTVSADDALDMLATLAQVYADSNRRVEAVATLLSAPAQAAPAPFCKRETDVLRTLQGGAATAAQRPHVDALARAHAARCAP